MADGQDAAVRQHIAGNVAAVVVAAGDDVTHASANTENLIDHGAVDHNGNPYPVANLLLTAFPTSSEASVYQGTALSATQFDVRSSGTAVPFNWVLYLIN